MGNCKDCKFWVETDSLYTRKVWRECQAADWVDKGDTVSENGIGYYADAHDESGLTAGLITGPMFGCVLFQQAEEEESNA